MTSEAVHFAFAVPCHNEVANIGTLLKILSSVTFQGAHAEKIVVVSDASTDGTNDLVIEAARTSLVPIQLITRSRLLGKCSAINRCLQELPHVAVVVLVSADVIPSDDCIPKLLAAFRDPAVGVAGGRPLPSGDDSFWAVRVTKILWSVHHFIASECPKTTEITAFRNLGFVLNEASLVDEAEIEYAIVARGLRVAYVPEAIVHTPSPLTIRDYMKQRIRVTLGHLLLRQRTGFAIGSLSAGTRIKAVLRVIRADSSGWPALALGIILELAVYLTAKARTYTRPVRSGAWEPIRSTKRVVEKAPPAGPLGLT